MIKAKVMSVGKEALDTKDNFIILFGKEASERLKNVSVIQQITAETDFKVQAGMHLTIDQQKYQIEYVGELVADNLQSVHHTVLDFNPVPTNPRSNSIYLTPHKLPQITAGSEIIID